MAKDEAYQQAEQKIAEALKIGATELVLGGEYETPNEEKLSELPESLWKCKHLKSLRISHTKLITLPPSLGQLTQLTELHLSSNQLTAIPDSLSQLTQLTELVLSNNQLTTLPDSLGQLTQLTELVLSNNQMTTLPDSLGQLTQLTKLYLSNNQLTALPPSLGQLTQLINLNLSNNQLTTLPDSLGQLTQLETLTLSNNQLATLPDSLGQLTQLHELNLERNHLTTLPISIGNLKQLERLRLSINPLESLPETIRDCTSLIYLVMMYVESIVSLSTVISKITSLESLNFWHCQCIEFPNKFLDMINLTGLYAGNNGLKTLPARFSQLKNLKNINLSDNEFSNFPYPITQLENLEHLSLSNNQFTDIPHSLAQLKYLKTIEFGMTPLKPELAEAYDQGAEAVKLYLRAGAVIPSYESKLILVGEGEVGKTCLMDALLDKEWQEHPSTHGIEIQKFKVLNSVDKNHKEIPENERREITLNGWDFGGQRVYRPTHQLFFSAPAVYLVVWKPREGPQQGFVKEWIQLVKRREPSAKIIVVATHGGPQQRQPDIDRQELWDIFGKDTVVDFFWVDSKPDENGKRKGIEELKEVIARVATELPEVGRSVPKSFADVRATLAEKSVPYLPLNEVLAICHAHNMDDEIARLFITISHRLGHLTHYENDPALRDIVILRPDWLATAMSYVLDDESTRNNQGLVKLSRLSILWNDPARPAETRYTEDLHRIFLRLMERFDLSYRVAGLSKDDDSDPVSLIAQLVPDTTPQQDILDKAWSPEPTQGDIQQTQICRIVDAGNGQSANAEGLFYQLIVRLHRYSLGRNHWDDSVHWQRGLVLDANYNGRAILRHIGNDVHITVRAAFPERFLGMLTEEVKYLVDSFWEGLRCDVTVPCLNPNPCAGLFEVEKLIENKKRGRPEQPCSVCNQWQSIDELLNNAPDATEAVSLDTLMKQFAQVKDKLDEVNDNTKRILSQVDKQYADLIQLFTDEAKEGPRLFSLFPLDGNNFNPKTWVRHQFRLVLWCENARLPLPALNNGDMKKGVYDLEFDREWFQTAAPYLKFLTGTLSLVLPMASSTLKVIDETAFKSLENQLNLGKNVIDAIAGEGTAFNEIMGKTDVINLEQGVAIRAQNSTLRELHSILKAKDPGFGGLVRVMNKRQEFLWVHEKYASEY